MLVVHVDFQVRLGLNLILALGLGQYVEPRDACIKVPLFRLEPHANMFGLEQPLYLLRVQLKQQTWLLFFNPHLRVRLGLDQRVEEILHYLEKTGLDLRGFDFTEPFDLSL